MINKKIKINILIPFLFNTGGIKVILEYYTELKKMGHDIVIYYPMIPYFNHSSKKIGIFRQIYRNTKYFVKKLVMPIKSINWFYEPIPVKPVILLKNLFIRNADISIATAWPTANDAYWLSEKKGKKVYFVQGFEVFSGNRADVLKTYTLPLNIISISPWLTQELKKYGNPNIIGEVYNSIRFDKFYPVNKTDNNVTILALCSDVELKGTKEVITALEILKKEFNDINLVLFGMIKKPQISVPVTYYQNPSHEQILECYQTADIFISPSHFEGWGLPVMEAMACKCAVIATKTGCVPLLNTGKNMVLIRPKSPKSIVRGCTLLILDNDRRQRIAEEGYNTVKKYTWQDSAKKMESLLIDLCKNEE